MTIYEMEKIWGPAATHAEHKIQERVSYNIEGQIRSGTIIWTCAPATKGGKQLPMRYVVAPDHAEGLPTIVLPGNIVVDDKPGVNIHRMGALSEQALLEMLATLPVPIFIQEETDDNGQRFYEWHVGHCTKEHPCGLYVGAHRHLMEAVKFTLELVMKGIPD